MLRSHGVRVYRPRHDTDKVACLYATGRRFALEERGDGLYAYPPPALAAANGRVAYAVDDETDPNESTYTDVAVFDLRRNHHLWSGNAGEPSDTFATVGSVVLNNRGSVAWIACPGVLGRGRIRDRDCNSETGSVQVVKREAGGKAVVLDAGAGISPGSLKRHEATLSWVHGDVRRTATMR